MNARLMMNLSCTTLAAGPGSWCAGSVGNDMVLGRIVLVLVDAQHDGQVFAFAGAEMMTFLAPPAVMWLTAPLTVLPFLLTPSSLMVNRPVDSITMSTPRSFQGMAAGRFP